MVEEVVVEEVVAESVAEESLLYVESVVATVIVLEVIRKP